MANANGSRDQIIFQFVLRILDVSIRVANAIILAIESAKARRILDIAQTNIRFDSIWKFVETKMSVKGNRAPFRESIHVPEFWIRIKTLVHNK